MITKHEIVQTEAQPCAAIRITVPRSEIQHVMGPGYQELMDTLGAQGVAPAGPWFNHHLRMDPEVFDFELGVPVAAPLAPAGRVTMSELPAATVARTVYSGPYEGLADAWGAFNAQLAAAGLTPADGLWERYLAGPETGPDPAQWRTELNQPLRSV